MPHARPSPIAPAAPVAARVAALAAALLVGSLVAADACCTEAAPGPEAAEALIGELAVTLKGELETAMKSGGPIQAIGVCKERAPAIAAGLAARSGWTVRRTALKTRNLAQNAPDGWEREVLERFERRQAAGKPVDSMVFAQILEQDGTKRYSYMKAIPTAQVCLACHGASLAPEVEARLGQDYPGDQARGHALGDLRGAYSLSKPL
jgi:hypothetical protein